MGKIQLLDIETSNKIAAGEVVERPASVIKELVENSIDAGASKISVEIQNGGNVRMCVTDNGSGMSIDDASIAFLRHATSKIKTGSDLDAIFTLGFRREALASVGAVSRSEILTREKNAEFGACVSCDGGEIVAEENEGVPFGTKITVCDLFYNTPARRKFLKKDTTEAGYISDIMERFILAYPDISFKLVNNGKETLFSTGDGNPKNAVYSVYGKDYANAMLEVLYKTDNITVSGLIGKGTLCRPNRNFQSFFVNRRYIKSGLLIKAAEEAYKNQIMIGKFPVLALNIEINPENIDINVHPTKLEVKFSDERAIYEAVYYAVKNALYAMPNVPEIKKEEKQRDKAVETNFKREESGTQVEIIKPVVPEKSIEVKKEVLTEKKTEERTQEPVRKVTEKKSEAVFDPLAQSRKKETPEKLVFKQPEREYSIEKIINKKEEQIKEPIVEKKILVSDEIDSLIEAKNEDIPPFKVVGQVFATYIVAESGDDMLLIDQHAAHERLKYEELLLELSQKKMYPQVLLEPVIVSLSGAEKAEYDKNADVLAQFGFENEEFGDRDVIIRTSPADVEWADVESLFLELLTKMSGSKHEVISDKFQRMIYTIACKAAIKANHFLSVSEMERLVHDCLALKNINTCPHGRPIIIKMTKKELEKQFKRIV